MENNDINEQPKTENQPKENKNWAMWLLIALVVLLLAGAGYLWWQLQTAQSTKNQLTKDKQELQQKVDKLTGDAKEAKSASGGTELTACTYTPSATFKDNIRAALDSKNTAAFATYVTDPVKYILAASEYGGNVDPDEAAKSLEYTHSATGPWDFDLPKATTDGYKAGGYKSNFSDNTLFGKAASGMVVAFDFNCDGTKITKIFVSAVDDLL